MKLKRKRGLHKRAFVEAGLQTRLQRVTLFALFSVMAGLGVSASEPGPGQRASSGVAKDAAVNTRDVDGTTALHWAVYADDLAAIEKLLRAGARADAANRYGVTPIGIAAGNGNAAAIDLLVAAGANPNSAPPEGEPALMTAARAGSADAVKRLLAHGAKVNAIEPWRGENALMWAAAANHAAVVRILIAAGADINARSAAESFPRRQTGLSVLPRGQWTALMYAARQGALEAARGLADAGADLNLRDPDGTTALVLAIINAHYDTADLLAGRGADPNSADDAGMAALYAAVDMHTLPWMFGRPDPKTPDTLTAADVVKTLLDHGANPNAGLKTLLFQRSHTGGDFALAEGSTPFMRAAKSGDMTVIRLLLEKGADPGLIQKNRTTALMLAAGLGWRDGNAAIPTRDRGSVSDAIEAITVCLDRGIDIHAVNDSGDTALHAAAVRGAPEIIRFLVGRGANLQARNKQGRTPLDVALARRGASAVPAAVAAFRALEPRTANPEP